MSVVKAESCIFVICVKYYLQFYSKVVADAVWYFFYWAKALVQTLVWVRTVLVCNTILLMLMAFMAWHLIKRRPSIVQGNQSKQ